jgi:hypothetical protein
MTSGAAAGTAAGSTITALGTTTMSPRFGRNRRSECGGSPTAAFSDLDDHAVGSQVRRQRQGLQRQDYLAVMT